MFGKNKTTIEKLSSKSGKLLSVFSSTIEGLSAVNIEAENEIEARTAQIELLGKEKVALQEIKADNEKFIGKLTALFE